MAIIIYSQMAHLPPYQKALPAPVPKPEHAPETIMGTPVGHNVNDSAEFHPDTGVATMPAAPTPAPAPAATPAPGPVLAPEPVAPAAMPPAAPNLSVGDHLQSSSNPLDNLAHAFQDEYRKQGLNENTTFKHPFNETQNNILMQALSQPMKNPDGSPMTYRVRTKAGKVEERPMTLEKFVQNELRDAGIDPDEAYSFISHALRTTKKDFMSALKSKMFYHKKHTLDQDLGWQSLRAKRSLKKFKDYFDPKSDKFVPGSKTEDIAKAFEDRAYGPIEQRVEKAKAWNEMYNKVAKMTGYQDPRFDEIRVDTREPSQRKKRGKPSGAPAATGQQAKPFERKQDALNSLVAARKLFTQFMAKHPEEARKIGLQDFMTPGGRNYLSKAMVYPAEDNIEADIETARLGLNKGAPTSAPKGNKIDSDDTENQAFHDLDTGRSPDDEDDSFAFTSKRTVVAAVADTIYHDEDAEVLHKVAMLLSSLRIPTTDAVTAKNVDTMMEWLNENSDLFPSDSASSSEQKFASAVKRVLSDCAAMLDGEESFKSERTKLRTAGIVLASKIARG
jgi:hypothetical protein